MSIKLICIDMDGTLLMDQQNVAEEDKKAIKEAVKKGVIVAITTGRIYDCARMYSDTIGLKTPIIASNGAYIGGVNDEEIYNNPLKQSDLEDFNIITKKNNLFTYVNTNWGIVSTVELPEDHVYKVLNKTLPKDKQVRLEVVKDLDEAFKKYKGEILKGVCVEKEFKDKLKEAKEELIACTTDLEVVSSWDDNFEIMKKGSSKGEAVQMLAKYLGVSQEEVMCIGDSENDLSMITWAGTGVAMGNAIDSVKEVANYVTSDNKHGGVAEAIRKFVL
ncbi:Cof-type HAD-IIB family hydrolase [Clostridium perfringens]|nr:Cof-type HAD-IIB family hydrolase [Clostridium perfringens]MDK0984377.1 Cof-type HAD-IIB family hydrolase [Clostridium perfringens]